jgi:hypothetical protein
MTTSIYFHNLAGETRCVPYIVDEDSTEYICDGSGGSITFDGYYYIEEHAPPYPEDDMVEPWKRPNRYHHWLPATLYLSMMRREKEPYTIEIDKDGFTTYSYETLEKHVYKIEIYRRVIHECTDKYSKLDDSDGEEMSVCFFPTNKQTIYFRILGALDR